MSCFTQSSGPRYALHCYQSGWGLEICYFSTKLCWGVGLGGMLYSWQHCGEWWLEPNTVTCGEGCSTEVSGSLGVQLWKDIRQRGAFPIYQICHMRWVLGQKLDFGLMQCGDQPLKTIFSKLFCLSQCKTAVVNNHQSSPRLGGRWRCFLRSSTSCNLLAGEEEVIQYFGYSPKTFFRLSPISLCSFFQLALFILGRLFGETMLLRRLRFFLVVHLGKIHNH